MRFLADENFPGDAVTALRTSGHDVLWIRTDASGITDQEVLSRSLEDARVPLTFDIPSCNSRPQVPIVGRARRRMAICKFKWIRSPLPLNRSSLLQIISCLRPQDYKN